LRLRAVLFLLLVILGAGAVIAGSLAFRSQDGGAEPPAIDLIFTLSIHCYQ
jgi:hypothetical protein